MELDAGDAREAELLRILATHTMSLLRVRDVLALGHTCSRMRAFTQTELPPSTWFSIAANSFTLGAPMLLMPQQDIGQEVRRLAALHASIGSGLITSEASVSMRQTAPQHPMHASVSPSGRLVIAKQGEQLQVFSLDLSQPPHAMLSELCSIRAPEQADLFPHLSCEFVWASDDTRVAIMYCPHDGAGEAALPSMMAHFGVIPWHMLYVLEIDTRRLHTVTTSSAFTYRPHAAGSNLGAHAFAPSSTLLIAPWSRYACLFIHFE